MCISKNKTSRTPFLAYYIGVNVTIFGLCLFAKKKKSIKCLYLLLQAICKLFIILAIYKLRLVPLSVAFGVWSYLVVPLNTYLYFLLISVEFWKTTWPHGCGSSPVKLCVSGLCLSAIRMSGVLYIPPVSLSSLALNSLRLGSVTRCHIL